jgi:Protein of unknown function (DUF3152)
MRALLAVFALLLAAASAADAEALVVGSVGSSHAPTSTVERSAAPPSPGPRGKLRVVPGRSRAFGRGDVRRFVVEVEGGVWVDRVAFARRVTRILADRRSWRVPVRRVSSKPIDFRVALASPRLTDRICAPLLTNGIFSCAEGNRAILNSMRWRRGAAAYRRDLYRYRIYMVNHEVGHVFGHGHSSCRGGRLRAPVMMQQTKGIAPCRANPWPLAWER